jgi:D-glycero-alpha-D-manno-heptose-7-phosphate kinase
VIVARAPLRISLLGGTTDFLDYFGQPGKVGKVLGFGIDKYVYVCMMRQPESEQIRFRFTWRFSEGVVDALEIKHPVVRHVLSKLGNQNRLNIATMADLPGRSGLGSSSSFCVALLGAIEFNSNQKTLRREEIAREAVRIERDELGEPGGYQDQYFAALGGFRLLEFKSASIDALTISNVELIELINKSMVLVAHGGSRDSLVYSKLTQANISSGNNIDALDRLSNITEEVFFTIKNGSVSDSFAHINSAINESWQLKCQITGHNKNDVDELLAFGLKNGALSAKLCGAGGSGYALFLVNPDQRETFTNLFQRKSVVNTLISGEGLEVKSLENSLDWK